MAKTPTKIRFAVLISGRGSNLKALIKAASAPDYPGELALVIANQPDAGGIALARDHHIRVLVINHRDYHDRARFEDALTNALEEEDIALICLAGFMRMLSADFVARWAGRVINIHPSLLPAYKGLDVYRRMIDDAVKIAGCTVHYVTAQMDAGEIIGQRAVPVLPGEGPEELAARVLHEEHILYPACVRIIAEEMLAASGKPS